MLLEIANDPLWLWLQKQIAKKLSSVFPRLHNSWALCWCKDIYKGVREEKGCLEREVWWFLCEIYCESSSLFGEVGELLPFKGELEIVFCIWRTSPEPWRAKLDFKLGSDSLGNMASMTRLTHGLDDRARKGAVLGLQYPCLLGQGCVKFLGRSHVGHAGENWFWFTWREKRSYRVWGKTPEWSPVGHRIL